MIVGHRKPVTELLETISGFRKILILGCGTCVTVSLTGGNKEALALAEALNLETKGREDRPEFEVNTIERQCEKDWITSYLNIPEETDAILSLACGAGVQTVAAVIKHIPVLPALNTTFLGAQDEPGVFNEKCHGCGDCLLAYTGGICPVARCAKKLFNGPCGGASKGKCEISPLLGRDVDCAWQAIINRFEELGIMERYHQVQPPRDWQPSIGSGPRELNHNKRMPYRIVEEEEEEEKEAK